MASLPRFLSCCRMPALPWALGLRCYQPGARSCAQQCKLGAACCFSLGFAVLCCCNAVQYSCCALPSKFCGSSAQCRLRQARQFASDASTS